jgi:hypothetical protein
MFTSINKRVDDMLTIEIHEEAIQAAHDAVNQHRAKHGNKFFGCGFAWVTSYEKGNTKLGKSFVKIGGFDKSYDGGYKLWDPANTGSQCIVEKEEGARAYVDTVKKYLPGIKLYANSRLD